MLPALHQPPQGLSLRLFRALFELLVLAVCTEGFRAAWVGLGLEAGAGSHAPLRPDGGHGENQKRPHPRQ